MNLYSLQKTIYALLMAFVLLSACNGQNKTVKQNNHDNTMPGQTKISSPTGVNQNVRFVTSIEDTAGHFWFGSSGAGVYHFDGQLFVHFDMAQGLNSNNIHSMLQDNTGKLWVGTDKGLNRFDGHQFVNVPMVLSNSMSAYLSNTNNNIAPTENAVWSMMQAKNGTIWFGTDDGVYCYKENTFTRFLDNSTVINKDSLKLKGIFSILEAKNGTLYFAECAAEGISSFDGKTLSTIIPYQAIRRTDRIIEDKQNKLWFATAFKGIGYYDGKTYTPNIFKAQAINGSYNIIEDTYGHLWFDTQNGLGFYDGKTHKLLTALEGTFVKDFIPILLDKVGNLWFSSNGLKLIKYNGKTLNNYSE